MRSKVDSQVGSVLDSQPEIRKPTTSAPQGSQRLMTWACATKMARKPTPTAPLSLPGPVTWASENRVAGICSESDSERQMEGVSCLSLQRIGRSVGNPCDERNEKALSFLSRRENEVNDAAGRTFRCCAAKGRTIRRPEADRGSLRGRPSVNGPGAARCPHLPPRYLLLSEICPRCARPHLLQRYLLLSEISSACGLRHLPPPAAGLANVR